jgi:hypothetical protein
MGCWIDSPHCATLKTIEGPHEDRTEILPDPDAHGASRGARAGGHAGLISHVLVTNARADPSWGAVLRVAAVLSWGLAVLVSPTAHAAAKGEPPTTPTVKAVPQTGVGRGQIWAVAWMPDGKHVITASDNGFIIFWDTFGEVVDRIGQANCQLRLGRSGHVVPRPGPTNCIIPEIRPPPADADHFLQTTSLSVSPDGRYIVMVGEAFGDTEVEVYDADTRLVAGWLHRRPIAWVAGDMGARMIVEPAEGCALARCTRSVIDLASLGSGALSETPGAGAMPGRQIPTFGPAQAISPDGTEQVSAEGIGPVGDASAVTTPLKGFEAIDIDSPVVAPDGRRFAMVFSGTAPGAARQAAPGAWVFDMERGRLFQVYPSTHPGAASGAVGRVDGWISDHRLALTDIDGRALSVDIDTGESRPLGAPPLLASPYAPAAAAQSACNPDPVGRRPVGRDENVVLSACYQWTWQEDGQLVLYSARTWKTLFSLSVHPDGTWFALDDGGRYDTDRGVETTDLQWLLSSQPWRLLPVQTFMRDYYQPGLMGRLLDCAASPTCATPFKALPDLSTLNLALPTVRIVGVKPGRTPDTVSVQVQAVEGVDPAAPPERRRSGVYDLRLFRCRKLVAQLPPSKPQAADGVGDFRLADWQGDTAVPSAEDGLYTFEDVAIPTHGSQDPWPWIFSAYAFNSSRVKGEEELRVYRPGGLHPRPRRAFVIAIGADDYPALPDHALRFAVNDARAISASLKTFLDATRDENGRALGQPYVIVPITLVSNWTADQAAKADIHAVIDVLAGKAGESDRQALAAAGAAVAGLDKATPDDLVIIAFAGHGWTNAVGDFYLLPSDARRPDANDPASLATLISSAELADWLRGVDAGEMALIIDACHSAASVTAEGFKPGPMGDPGLGQLAYDKGIRILAATQADDVAQESATLGGGHGLLTYVLVDKALSDPKAGGADRDANDTVRLDALLNYVVDRMPAEAARLLNAPPPWLAAAGWKPLLGPRDPTSPEPPHVQQPSLFDFTGQPSPAAVKPLPARAGS